MLSFRAALSTPLSDMELAGDQKLADILLWVLSSLAGRKMIVEMPDEKDPFSNSSRDNSSTSSPGMIHLVLRGRDLQTANW